MHITSSLLPSETTKITNYKKNLPKSANQNHKRCVPKSPNKREQKSRYVVGVSEPGITFELDVSGAFCF